MNLLKKFSNGIALIIIALVHTQYVVSEECFAYKFRDFAGSCFFSISEGTEAMPPVPGLSDFEAFAAFWFFYFGILLIPLGFLVHSVEKQRGYLPKSFTISYLLFVLMGSYMVPNSGMTMIMLPHALFMLVFSIYRSRKLQSGLQGKKHNNKIFSYQGV